MVIQKFQSLRQSFFPEESAWKYYTYKSSISNFVRGSTQHMRVHVYNCKRYLQFGLGTNLSRDDLRLVPHIQTKGWNKVRVHHTSITSHRKRIQNQQKEKKAFIQAIYVANRPVLPQYFSANEQCTSSGTEKRLITLFLSLWWLWAFCYSIPALRCPCAPALKTLVSGPPNRTPSLSCIDSSLHF